MSKLITLLVVLDQFGHYPAGLAKQFPLDQLKVVGDYKGIVSQYVPDPNCNNKSLAFPGDKVTPVYDDATALPYQVVLQLKYRDEWIFAIVTKNQMIDIQNACCAAGALPTLTLAVDAATKAINTAFVFTATPVQGADVIAKVEFFELDTLLGSDNAAPFTLNKAYAVAGVRFIVAKTTDAKNQVAYSNMVKVTITP